MGSRWRSARDVAVAGALAGAMLVLYALAAGMVPGLDLGLALARLVEGSR